MPIPQHISAEELRAQQAYNQMVMVYNEANLPLTLGVNLLANIIGALMRSPPDDQAPRIAVQILQDFLQRLTNHLTAHGKGATIDALLEHLSQLQAVRINPEEKPTGLPN